jgi:hypothetical protein
MTIKASDCIWAKVVLDDRGQAESILKEVEAEIKALKRFIAEGWFEDAFTENEMKKELARLEAIEDELVDVLFQDMFDLP